MSDIAAEFFELWGAAYLGQFSQYMYKADLYLQPLLYLLVVPVVVLLVYYVLWDNIRFAKTWVWTVVLLVVSAVVAMLGYNIADAGIYDYLTQHHIVNTTIADSDYTCFALICFAWTFVYSFIISLVMKNFSVKGRYVPF